MKTLVFNLTLIAATVSGCATVLSGVDQEIAITTSPAGAECEIFREGEKVASVHSTPGTALVQKTKHDLKMLCRKDGYLATEGTLVSGAESSTFANILFGGTGLVLWGIDSAAGADNHYPSSYALTLASPTVINKEKKSKL
jgi:hypothetical protein